jgi:hypothetical protein
MHHIAVLPGTRADDDPHTAFKGVTAPGLRIRSEPRPRKLAILELSVIRLGAAP